MKRFLYFVVYLGAPCEQAAAFGEMSALELTKGFLYPQLVSVIYSLYANIFCPSVSLKSQRGLSFTSKTIRKLLLYSFKNIFFLLTGTSEKQSKRFIQNC